MERVTLQNDLSLSRIAPFINGDLAFLQERGIPPMAWSPLGGGALMTEDRAAVAAAWLLAHPAGILPVRGTNNLNRINGFSDAFKVEMTRPTWFKLHEAALGHEVP